MNSIVILAAGKGTRMNSLLPKVLVPLHGRPMIRYLFDAISNSGLDIEPVLVLSPDNKNIISSALSGHSFKIALQKEQLGTGHALHCAKEYISADCEHLVVFNGDHPFIQPETIRRLVDGHTHADTPIAMMTTEVPDFTGWYKTFQSWGRIVRDENKRVSNIIEYRDADSKIRLYREVNAGLYCFKSSWLWENITKIKNQNNQHEYYVTDLIKIATDQGFRIFDNYIEPWETIGVNSQEELLIAEEIFKQRLGQ